LSIISELVYVVNNKMQKSLILYFSLIQCMI
jgi:hypothetical protein